MLQHVTPGLFNMAGRVAKFASRVGIYADMARACDQSGAVTLLDIGANRGQFASRIRAAGWSGKIVSFEPIPDLHGRLLKRAATDPKWVIADRIALGDKPAKLTLNIASNDGRSSSLLGVKSDSKLYGSAFSYVSQEEVDVVTLDDWLSRQAHESPYAIKIDVQGFELMVLRGALSTLSQTRIAMLEAPLVETYEGGATFGSLMEFMGGQGFRLIDAQPSCFDDKGTVVELDVIFGR